MARAILQTLVFGRHFLDRTKLKRRLDFISACGFNAVEIAQPICEKNGFVSDREELINAIENSGLELAGLAGASIERRVDWSGPSLRPYLYIDHVENEKFMLAVRKGFSLAVHNHMFTGSQNINIAAGWTNSIRESHGNDSAFLMPDVAHLVASGIADPQMELAKRKSLIRCIHLKDWSPRFGVSPHSYSRGFCNLGQGVVPIDPIVDWLKANDDVSWVWELDYTDSDPIDEVEFASKYLRKKGLIKTGTSLVVARNLNHGSEARRGQSLVMRGPAIRLSTILNSAQAGRIDDSMLILKEALQASFGDEVSVWIPKGRRPVFAGGNARHRIEYRSLVLNHAICGRIAVNDNRFFVPVLDPTNPHVVRAIILLELSVYPITGDDAAFVGKLVSDWLGEVIDSHCYAAATHAHKAVALANTDGGITDLQGYLNKLVDVFSDEIGCEVVSIFRYNGFPEQELELLATNDCNESGLSLSKPPYHDLTSRVRFQAWNTERPVFFELTPQQKVNSPGWIEPDCLCQADEMIVLLYSHSGEKWGLVSCKNKKAYEGKSLENRMTGLDFFLAACIASAAAPHISGLEASQDLRISRVEFFHILKQPLVRMDSETVLIRPIWNPGAYPDFLRDVTEYRILLARAIKNAKYESVGEYVLSAKTPSFLIRDVVAAVVRQIGPQLDDKNLPAYRIDYSGMYQIPMLLIDRNKIQQVFLNLMSNSIKYARDSKNTFNIIIEGSWNGDTLEISYKDFGIGIPERFREEIFKEGFRVPTARIERVDGEGLGLRIVSKIIELHGGNIWLSQCQDPTEFRISLPRECVVFPIQGI